MNDYYVYLHIKSTDGSPFYVGKGKDRRAYSKKGRSPFWKRTVAKYGYDVLILEDNLDESTALEREVYWIQRIGRRNNNTGPLVNITKGGDGGDTFSGRKHTEETKAKMRASMKGKQKGKVISKEQREQHREFMKNNSPTSRRVLNTVTGVCYDTITAAAKSIDMSPKGLMRRLNPNSPDRKNNTPFIYA